MTNTEKVKHIREITFSPINKINEALGRANGDVDGAVKILVAEKQADANDMANRVADAKIVYSYVHNNRIGAMIVLAGQTDFVTKNELFLGLAKDICMHIVSTPQATTWVDSNAIPPSHILQLDAAFRVECSSKPPQIADKIVVGRFKKYFSEVCLVNQKFVKDDTKTVGEVINAVAATLGEKIEVKQFVKMLAQ